MFGKIMRIPDSLIRNYFELLTDVSEGEISNLTGGQRVNPRDAKETLAKTVIAQFHSPTAADAAAAEFRRVHGGGMDGLPDEMLEVALPAEKVRDGAVSPLDLILIGLGEKSRNEARRLVAQRGVKLNGVAIADPNAPIAIKTGDILQRGNRRFVRLVVS
jgi:tyrosyl-tRNA synthetase